jgi:transcription elongation factor Elf1
MPKGNMIEQKFQCPKCKAEDIGRFFPNEPIPVVINCWKCHAGHGYKVAEMIQERAGMFQLGKAAHVD